MTNKEFQIRKELQDLYMIYANTDMSIDEYKAHRKILVDKLEEIKKNEG